MGFFQKNNHEKKTVRGVISYFLLCLMLITTTMGAPSVLAAPAPPVPQKAPPPPPAPKQPDSNKPHIQDEMIVRLISGVQLDNATAQKYGATILDTIPDLNIYRIGYDPSILESDAIAQIASSPYVDYIDLNYTNNNIEGNPRIGSYGFQTQYQQQYAATQISAISTQQNKGPQEVVAVLDTGVNQQHPVLQHHISGQRFDFINNNNNPNDVAGGTESGHGTAVASLVLLADPQSQIMPLRVLDQNGQGNLWNLIKAIDYAVDNHANVINMSLGTTANSNSLADLINYANQQGVVLVSSAGNDGSNEIQYPCAYQAVICVAATDSLFLLAPFSNYGSDVDLTAPGVALYTPYLGTGYATWSGTSMSAPLVAGGAALVQTHYNTKSPAQTATYLEKGATNIYTFNPLFLNELGYGCLNIAGALQAN